MDDMSWEELLARTDLIGRDAENRYSGNVYRGPVTSVYREDNDIKIATAWTANSRSNHSVWRVHNLSRPDLWVVPIDVCQVFECEKGLIKIRFVWLTGNSVLFLPHGNNLDPATVEGLELSK